MRDGLRIDAADVALGRLAVLMGFLPLREGSAVFLPMVLEKLKTQRQDEENFFLGTK